MVDVLIPIADGFEEIEALTLVDLFRRAGFAVDVAGIDDGPVKGAHGVAINPDTGLDAVLQKGYDLVVLPGGMPNADLLNADRRIHGIITRHHDDGRYVAAICASPRVLADAGLLRGKRATSYPGTLDRMADSGAIYTAAAVEVDGRIATSRGPGTAMEFALTLIELLAGCEAREEVEQPLLR